MTIHRDRVTYWPFNVLFAVVPGALAAVCVVALVRTVLSSLGLDHIDDGNDLPSGVEWVRFVGVLGLFIGAFGFLAARALRRGVLVSDVGCTARCVFITRRIPWAEIEHFTVNRVENDEGPDLIVCRVEGPDRRKRRLPIGSWTMRGSSEACQWLNERRRRLDRATA